MPSMGRVALAGLVFGSALAAGVMAAVAARAAFIITAGNRWYQLKHL